MAAFKLSLNNLRNNDVYLLLTSNTGKTQSISGITPSIYTPISSIPNNELIIEYIDSGRLYFTQGLPTDNPPTPNGDTYYGWVEFSQKKSDCINGVSQFWINLSNVDIFGLPLSISGTDINNEVFSLGYASGATQTIEYLGKKFPKAISKAGLFNKILAPNIEPYAYLSFNTYLGGLIKSGAKMTIISDTTSSGTTQTFKGGFVNNYDKSLSGTVIVSLVDDKQNTFKITDTNLTSDIIYKCDGGSIYYNNIKLPQNRSGKTDNEIVTNSVFREIVLGLNEGYFIPNGNVNSCYFPTYTPFLNGGNKYAEEIHKCSNSYGFPYADSNLKVLITATASTSSPVTITICDDITPFGFTNNSISTNNAPTCDDYTFGIGTGSSVGDIQIGSCTYTAGPNGTYGNNLPSYSGWTQMYFSGKTSYIWVLTSGNKSKVIYTDNEGNDCFIGGQPSWIPLSGGRMYLVWGANITLNPKYGTPVNHNLKKNCTIKDFFISLLTKNNKKRG
jgi:hypothetical protein